MDTLLGISSTSFATLDGDSDITGETETKSSFYLFFFLNRKIPLILLPIPFLCDVMGRKKCPRNESVITLPSKIVSHKPISMYGFINIFKNILLDSF